MKTCLSTTAVLLSWTIVLLLVSEGIEAKRGCASFGHSCYGGMGKRAEEPANNNEEVMQDDQQQENPEFVFTGPRSMFRPQPEQKLTAQDLYNLSPIIRQWLRNYRSAQELRANLRK